MKRIFRLCILPVIVACILYEMFLELQVYFAERHWRQESTSYYPWSTHTSDGFPLGKRRGSLKLLLHPGYVFTTAPNQSDVRFTTDASGFRGKSDVGAKTPGRSRIVVIGGSAAFGAGLERDNDTFEMQIEQLAPSVEVINAAVIGHMSRQEFARFALELVDLKPDLVISLSGMNDLNQGGEPIPTYGLGFGGYDQVEAELKQASWVNHRNPLVRLTMGGLTVAFPELMKKVQIKMRRARSNEAGATIEVVAENFAHNMSLLNAFARSMNIRFLLLLQPHEGSFAENDERFKPIWELYRQFRDAAKPLLRANAVLFEDLNDQPIPIRREMFLDEVHLNRVGHEVLARYIMTTATYVEVTSHSD